jgi:colicin import membrane protein
MRTGLVISTVGHAAALLWGLLTFNAMPFEPTQMESMPIDLINTSDFNKLMAGARNAPEAEKSKPVVDKVDEPKPAKDPTPKVVEKKPEIDTASSPPTPPPTPPEAKPEKQEKKEPKSDPIAEALKKEEAKKKAEAKPPTPVPPKRPTPPQPKFDAQKVAALLDKRDPQRPAATGATPNAVPALGTEAAESVKLSQTELDAFRARLMQLWNPPVGISNPKDFIIRIRVFMNPDGTLAAPPLVLTSGQGAQFNSARDSAVRALLRGQPFQMLRKETYDSWKDMEVTFDPRDMFRG